MNEYSTVYKLDSMDVIDGNKEYAVNRHFELVHIDALDAVASAVYRVTDDVFGTKYHVELKPEFQGKVKFFDRPLSENNIKIHAKYWIGKLLREAQA